MFGGEHVRLAAEQSAGQARRNLRRIDGGPLVVRPHGATAEERQSNDDKAAAFHLGFHGYCVRYYFFISAAFAAASSLSWSLPTWGYSRPREARVSLTAAATITRVNHLLSAGTTYHGAALVAVFLIMSSYASWYSSQYPRSFRSAAENFQFLSGFSIRSRNRRFCSFCETYRKNFLTTTPLCVRYCSKWRMSAKRSSHRCLVISSGGSFCFARNSGWTRTTRVSS